MSWWKSVKKQLCEAEKQRDQIREELEGLKKTGSLKGEILRLQADLRELREEQLAQAGESVELAVASPVAGEQWQHSHAATIKWVYSGLVGYTLRIDLLKNGILFREVSRETEIRAREFGWMVSNELPPAANYQVRLISRETRVIALGPIFEIIA